ncbi:hypothetical protein D3C85_1794350 [compost metagenome]
MAAPSMTLAPSFSSSFLPAIMVPPVAIRSSISTTRSPGFTASVCISTVALPYSSSYSSATVVNGSLPFLRIGTKPTFSS